MIPSDNKERKNKSNSMEDVKRRVRESIRYNQPDFWLLLSIVLLLGLGTMMVFSASSATAYASKAGSAYAVLKDQLLNAVIGVVAMAFVSFIDYKFLAKFTIPFFIGCNVLLVLVQVMGITLNYAKRWLKIGITFQPSEFYKIAVILYCIFNKAF